jgi:hypothetical protein
MRTEEEVEEDGVARFKGEMFKCCGLGNDFSAEKSKGTVVEMKSSLFASFGEVAEQDDEFNNCEESDIFGSSFGEEGREEESLISSILNRPRS